MCGYILIAVGREGGHLFEFAEAGAGVPTVRHERVGRGAVVACLYGVK